MPFVQLVEFRTDRIDEFDAALGEWLEQSKGLAALCTESPTP
jgi:hypothetical protein